YWGVRLALLAGFITLAVGVTSPAMDFIFWISNLLGFPSHTDLTAGEVGLIAGVEGQMSNLDTGSGSMWKRLTMYGDLAGIAAAHPFGVGPGMIGPYFEANPSASGLSNPHNWWLEFLCLYGIPATIAYAAFLFYALVQMAVRYRKTGQFTCVLAIVSYIAVGFGSVAPSSFDYTAYAWIPVLLAIASFQNEEDRKRCLIGGDIDPACPPRILFVSFKDLDAPASSASIKRPREMLRAFRDIGCDVMVLEGLPNRYMERNRNVSSLMRSIRSGERVFDLCYVEPPAGPMLCRRDLSLLRLIRQRGIPLGYFYRDAYWLTEDALAGASFKQRVIYFLSKRDFETFNAAATIIYHPGAVSVDWAMKAAASKGHPYKAQAGILPPGCEWVSEAATSHVISGEAPTAIYVGAADERYGTPLLLDSFMRINEKEVVCRLIFVCPKNQWDTLDARYQVLKDSVDWLDVEHLAAGEELARVYSRADIGLMSYRRCEYNDAAIPVKMFEYLSYCKPIVTTDIPGAASFVREWNLGLVVPDAASSYAAAIERLVNTPDLLDYYRENARQAVPHNTWKSRALQVCRDLLEDMSS
ncbi:MAG: glycosyltransferase, partial [Clostridia bacterium]